MPDNNYIFQQIASKPVGYELPDLQISLVVPEPGVNMIVNPSFEKNLNYWFFTDATGARVNTFQTSGGYGLEVTPNGTSVPATVEHLLQSPTVEPRMANPSCLSFDLQASPGESFTIQTEKPLFYDRFNLKPFAGYPLTIGGASGSYTDATASFSIASGLLTSNTNNSIYQNSITPMLSFNMIFETRMNGDYNNATNYRQPALMLLDSGSGTYATETFIYVILASNAVTLKKSVSGVETQLATNAFTLTPGTAVKVKAVLLQNGATYTIQVFANDVSQFTYTLTAGEVTTFASNNGFGFFLKRGGSPTQAATWEYLKITANPPTIFNTVPFQTKSGINRYNFAISTLTGDSNFPYVLFSLKKTTLTTKKFQLDSVQLEPHSYPTSYIDGDQPNCIWDATSNQSSSERLANSQYYTGGREYFLRDLGLRVTGHKGLGLPPVENRTQPNSKTGGETLQRTLAKKRIVEINAILEARNFEQLLIQRAKIEDLLSPNNLTNEARNILLRLQMIDCGGNVRGPILEAAISYQFGMEGSITNAIAEELTLRIEKYESPGITEFYSKYTNLAIANALNLDYVGYLRLDGVWQLKSSLVAPGITSPGEITFTGFDYDGNLLYGCNTGLVSVLAVGGYYTTIGSYNNSILTAVSNASGSVIFGGAFTNSSVYIMKTNPLTNGPDTALGGGVNGVVRALVYANSGNLYVGGDFTQANTGPVTANRLAIWNGAAYSAVGTGANASVRALAKGKDGAIYAAGDFTTFNGVAINRIVQIVGATYTALSTGLNGVVRALAVGPDGRLYAGGDFTTAGGSSCARVAVWNGTVWQPLGVGLNGPVYSLAFDANGLLYIGGSFTALGDGTATTQFLTSWNGSNYLPSDVALPSGATRVNSIAINQTTMLLGYVTGAFNANFAAITDVSYSGSAGAVPKIVFTATGAYTIYQLTNLTSGKSLYFNYSMVNGETVTVNLDPRNISFVSSIYGNLPARLLPGSDLGSFGLVTQPGPGPTTNQLALTTSGSGTAELYYKNTHWSFDKIAQA